jgi:two-component system, cell cycle sensor histidine kinase and response regulator CckA
MYRRDMTANLEWFGYGLLVTMVVGLFLPLWGGELSRRLTLIVPGIVLAIVVLISSRANAPRSAAAAAVGGAWIMLTYAAWTGGGITSAAYLACLIPTLAAGVLLGRRAAVVVLALSAVSGFLLAMAEAQGWLPVDHVAATSPYMRWSSRSLVLAMAVAIMYAADVAMDRAMARTRQDVEERRRAETAARETAQRLRVAMQAARMAAWEWDLERDELTWSDEAPALIGKPSAELASTIREAIARVHPDDRDSFERLATTLRNTANPGPVRFEQRLVAPDGTVRWFEELGQYYAATEDRPPRIVGVILDVTERRRIEALQAAVARGLSTQIGEDFFRSLVGHLASTLEVDFAFVGELVGDRTKVQTVGVFDRGVLGADFEYDLRGAPCEQVVGQGICTYPAGVQQRFPDDKALAAKGVEGYAGQPLIDSAGRPMGLLAVMSGRPLQHLAELESVLRIFAIRAATELERMHVMKAQAALETQLRQSQKMETVGQLAGGVAHDFNNLLSPILGYADLLLGDVHPDDHRRDYLQTIKDAAERAAALTRQLLTFSRRQLFDLTVFELNQAVAGFERILRRTIREDIAIDFRYGQASTCISGDVSQVEQILMNLVVNAQDAMPSGGRIVVETGEERDVDPDTAPVADAPTARLVTLTVSDTGTGMSPEVLQHVFEPFYTTKEKGRGTGLGLATVYGIVRQHRGSVAIDSQLGTGTRVTIRLPAAEPAQPRADAAARPAPPAPDASETVVVVEDDETVRELVRVVLQQRGYDVIAFADPQKCLEAGNQAACGAALLLTDIIMPGLNGRQLYERLRERCPSLKVLYMSGYADSVIADRAVGEDGIDLLSKPFTVETLVSRVRQAIGTSELPPVDARLLKG